MGILDYVNITQQDFDRTRIRVKNTPLTYKKKKKKKKRPGGNTVMNGIEVTSKGRPLKYATYINSDYWKQQRKYSLDFFGGKCALCNNDARIVHHRSYRYNDDRENEQLVALCFDCHGMFHENFEYNRQGHTFKKK